MAQQGGRSDDAGPWPDPNKREIWRVAAYALCRRGDEVLVVRASARTDVAGRWFLPGGGLQFGEDPRTGVLRELVEETGLTGAEPRLLDVVCDVRARSATVEICTVRAIFAVDDLQGELRDERDGSSDEARWVRASELEALGAVDYVLAAVGRSETK